MLQDVISQDAASGMVYYPPSMGPLELPSFSTKPFSSSSSLGLKEASSVAFRDMLASFRDKVKRSNDPVMQFQLAKYMIEASACLSNESLLDWSYGSGMGTGQSSESGHSNISNGSRQQGSIQDHGGHRSTTPPNGIPESEDTSGWNPSVSCNSLNKDSEFFQSTPLGSDENNGSLENSKQKDRLSPKAVLLAEGIKLMKRLANFGASLGQPPLLDAQYYLAECYDLGLFGIMPDPYKAFALYIQASKQNHPEATYRAALSYEEGRGTKKSNTCAVQFYRKAAALVNLRAMHKLGMILQNGLFGVTKNHKEAVTWLKRASAMADIHYPQPLHDLAQCYEKNGSMAVIPDEPYAYELFLRAADLGYPPSLYRIGACHEFGDLRCHVDPALSIQWYAKAAEQGYAEAELALSGWFLTGADGVLRQSDTDAYIWARRAADQESAKAAFAVGHFSEMGIGVRQDVDEAARWYSVAASKGNKRAAQRLSELRKLYKKNNWGALYDKKNTDCSIF